MDTLHERVELIGGHCDQAADARELRQARPVPTMKGASRDARSVANVAAGLVPVTAQTLGSPVCIPRFWSDRTQTGQFDGLFPREAENGVRKHLARKTMGNVWNGEVGVTPTSQQ